MNKFVLLVVNAYNLKFIVFFFSLKCGLSDFLYIGPDRRGGDPDNCFLFSLRKHAVGTHKKRLVSTRTQMLWLVMRSVKAFLICNHNMFS